MTRVPSYRCKKSNGRKYACVSLPDGGGGRHDVLLGNYGSKESKAEYARVITEWEAAGRKLSRPDVTPDITVNELMARYWKHAKEHYRHPDGSPTSELNDLRLSFRPLKALYGHTLARELGPLALKAVREAMIKQPITKPVKVADPMTGEVTWQEKLLRIGLARGVVNQRINRIRRLYRWGVENELVPSSVLAGLCAVRGLKRGRSAARETEKIKPVSIALVEDTLPHLSPTIADMIRLLLLTGMRVGELVIMRAADLDMSGPIWLYRPLHHKTAHTGAERVIALGPRAQEIIRPYLKPNTEEYLFSPRDSLEQWRQRQRQERKSKVQPSQLNRAKARPTRKPGDRYKPTVISHAIRVACLKHGLERWHTHQLRHTAATGVRREFGLDPARAVLGHRTPTITSHYAEIDLGKAVEVARKLG
jgi:integrase